jgi:hypothetical protein
MSDQIKTAFVLSGGASLGAIQVWMIQSLYEQALTPDLIAGIISQPSTPAKPGCRCRWRSTTIVRRRRSGSEV